MAGGVSAYDSSCIQTVNLGGVSENRHRLASTAYFQCGTAGATAEKVATNSDFTFDTVETGTTVHVRFFNVNTAASPTLKVGSTAAKSITNYSDSWKAGDVVAFTYDGSGWLINTGGGSSASGGYLPLSGGTLTGPLAIGTEEIDVTTAPATSQYVKLLELTDADGETLMSAEAVHETSGARGFQISSFGGSAQNTLQMLMQANGTPKMWISQAAAWRSALGAAAASHAHAASSITSGTLPTARGGTGLSASSAGEALNLMAIARADDLGLDTPEGVLFVDPELDYELDIGTVPLEYGGTGGYDQPSARLSLGVPVGMITRYLTTAYTCTASDAQVANVTGLVDEFDPHNILSTSGGNVAVEAGYVVEVGASAVFSGTTTHQNAALSIYAGTGTALAGKTRRAQSYAAFPASTSKGVAVSIAPIVIRCASKTYISLAARSTSAGATLTAGATGTGTTDVPTTVLSVRVIGKL